jgi:hypothetical protein
MFSTECRVHQPRRFAWVAEAAGAAGRDPEHILAFLVAHRIDREWELENILVAAIRNAEALGTL